MFLKRVITGKVLLFGVLFLALLPAFLISSTVFAASERALRTLKGPQLFPRELDDVWSKEIEPLHLTPSGTDAQELKNLYLAFSIQLKGLIHNPQLLSMHYEWIVKAISRMRDDQAVWGDLMAHLISVYRGNNINPILEAIGLVPEGGSTRTLLLLVKNGRLTRGKANQIYDVLEKVKAPLQDEHMVLSSLAEHYTGSVQDLLQIAKEHILPSSGASSNALAIYSGLLKNRLFREKSYPIIISSINEVMKNPEQATTNMKVRFLKDLIAYYVAGNSGKLLDEILAMGEATNDPETKLPALTEVYQALIIKAEECKRKSDNRREDELRNIYRKLRAKYPGVASST